MLERMLDIYFNLLTQIVIILIMSNNEADTYLITLK